MTTPEQVLRADIRALSAYHVPPSDGMLKLDAMENPYRLPRDMREDVARLAGEALLNRYPDPSAAALKRAIRAALKVPDELDLLLGNGSDEIIQMLALAVARPGAVLLGVEPSFVMFRMIATIAGLRYVGVPLTADFQLDLPAVLAAIDEHRPALTFIAYPNNPTGNLFDADAIAQIVRRSPGLVVADEAYHVFAARSFLPAIAQHSNLVVMRTVSKLGLAGLRLGYAAAHPDWIAEFDKVRPPYNVSILTQVAAEVTLRHANVLEEQAAMIRAERAELAARLAEMRGIEVFASEANFLLVRVKDAMKTDAVLRSRRILIRNLHGWHPLLANCLRLTVGTPGENELMVSALNEAL